MKMPHYDASARLLLPIAAMTLCAAAISCDRSSHATRQVTPTSTQASTATKATGSAIPVAKMRALSLPLTENVRDKAALAVKTGLAKPNGSEEWLTLDKNRLVPVASELERHLTLAQNAFRTHDRRLLASELRATAGILQPASGTTFNEARRSDLVSASKSLNQLATQAESTMPSAKLVAMNLTGAYDASMQAGLPNMQPDQWRAIDHYPLIHLAAARSALSKNARLAALELRKAESYMNVDAARANGAVRTALQADVAEISGLADKIGAGEAKQPSQLDRVSTHVAQTLSELYYQNAKDAWQKHDAVGSAQWLAESISDLREAVKAAGVAIDSDATNVLAAAEKFATGVLNNAQVDAKQMDKQIDQTGLELRRLVALTQSAPERSTRMATLSQQASAQHGSLHN